MPRVRMAAAALACFVAAAAAQPLTDPRKWSAADVAEWLGAVGYPEYANAFGSVDGKALLALNAERMERKLLLAAPEHRVVLEMEIGELRFQHGLMSAKERQAHRLLHPAADGWSAAEVGAFLADAGLERYSSRFVEHNIDGRMLLQLQPPMLRPLLDVQPNANEANEAALELLTALIAQLRRRSAGGKDEL